MLIANRLHGVARRCNDHREGRMGERSTDRAVGFSVGVVTRSGVRNCALAALLFGASTPAASVLAQDMEPLALAGLLYLGAALAVLPWWLSSRPTGTSLRRDGKPLAVAIVVGGAVGPALLTAGLAGTPAATASLLL